VPRFLIYEDVRETRKFVVDADDVQGAIAAWRIAQEAGDEGSFAAASTISYEVQRLDEVGMTVETYPTVQIE
jgi:hypothetical protein